MILECVANSGKELPPDPRGLYYSERTEFPVVAGVTYQAFGIALFNDGLVVLVSNKWDKPMWLPLGLFRVKDPNIPAGWEFAYAPDEDLARDRTRGWQARLGYPDLVRSDRHNDELLEGDEAALRVFFNQRELASDDES